MPSSRNPHPAVPIRLGSQGGLALLGAVVLWVAGLASPTLAAHHPSAGRWIPDAAVGEASGVSLRDQRAVFHDKRIRVEVELLDANRRTLFLQSAGIRDVDPFRSDLVGWRVFTFLLRLENIGEDAVEIRPQSMSFVTRRPVSISTPCDFACLQALAEHAGLDRGGAGQLVRAALDSSETLRPGQRLSKLLVFTRMPGAFKKFMLDLDAFSVAGQPVRFTLPYRIERPAKVPEERR
ncbi:MAG: hypothetical protein ACE5HD_11810 [Acidobacteriota bacterium]